MTSPAQSLSTPRALYLDIITQVEIFEDTMGKQATLKENLVPKVSGGNCAERAVFFCLRER